MSSDARLVFGGNHPTPAKVRSALKSFPWFIVASLLMCNGCVTPTGSYYDKYIGTIEPTYWVFKDGHVYCRAPGAPDQHIAPYTRFGDRWVMRGGPRDGDVFLRPGVFGIRFVPASGDRPYLNKYLPRRGFAWLNSGRIYDVSSEANR